MIQDRLSYEGYSLVFEDCFEGERLNRNHWNVELHEPGWISTQDKHDFIYGIFEAGLKVPKGRGFLPAFWLMASKEERYGFWPACGEIDIMEVKGDDTRKNYGTIHYGLPHEQNQGAVILKDGSFSDGYHNFALLWEPGRIPG